MSDMYNIQKRAAPAWYSSATFALLAMASLITLSSCGNQAYVATASVEAATAPGTMTIPAKVDILVVEDDTGSMLGGASAQVQAEMQTMLPQLQTYGWDYHFATIPLTTYRSLGQVAASQYDSNWGSSWIAPFPGAIQYDDSDTVDASVFRTYSNYSDYNVGTHSTTGSEPGLQNILNSLYSYQSNGTRFIRDDAMLVVIVIGNGNDTSLVNYCSQYGSIQPCDNYHMPQCTDQSQWGAPGQTCSSGAQSLAYFENLLTSLKASKNMIRFYAVVSNERVTNYSCYGGDAQIGTRYQQMAQYFLGNSYDVCGSSTAVSSSLAALSTELQNIRLSLETRYLPISQEPDPSTIVVTRNDGVVIPQDSKNGWTYAGYVTDGYQIDSPVNMDQFTGYAVELHGSYKLTGSQTATVTYTPNGLHSTP